MDAGKFLQVFYYGDALVSRDIGMDLFFAVRPYYNEAVNLSSIVQAKMGNRAVLGGMGTVAARDLLQVLAFLYYNKNLAAYAIPVVGTALKLDSDPVLSFGEFISK